MRYPRLHLRLSLTGYAEGAGVARGLRDGTLRQPPGPLSAVADAVELAIACARARGWEPAPDLVELACSGSADEADRTPWGDT